MPDNLSKSVESKEKPGAKPPDKAELGAESAAVSSEQVKLAQSTNKEMPSGSAGPTDGGSLEVDLNNGTVVSRKNPLTEVQALKKAKENSSEDNSSSDKVRNGSKRDNKANTQILKALASDETLSDESRKLVKSVQEIRENTKLKGLSTAAIDETAGEMLHAEIIDLKLREAALEKYSNAPVFQNELRIPLPDINSFVPGSIPRFVSIKLGPEDDREILKQFKQELERRDQRKLSDSDREKLHDIAVCDVVIRKYQDALTEREISIARSLPPEQRGGFLTKAAVLDGACLGGTKEVLHKVIAENEVENQMTGLGVGLLLGKTVGILATSSNLALRGIGVLLQTGGLALAAEEVSKIGEKYCNGFGKALPALFTLHENPSAKNLEIAKHLVENELGPPIADTALFAAGLAAGHAADRIFGKLTLKHLEDVNKRPHAEGKLAGAGRFWETIEQKLAKPLDQLEAGDLRVVKQHHRNSCVAAVGDMLTKGKFNHLDLIPRLNANWWPEYLKANPEPMASLKWLGAELGEKEWLFKNDYPDSMKAVDEVLGYSKEPFAVTFKLYGQDAHAVAIDGVTKNGLIKVRDPDGSYYKMTKEEFKRVWTGEALLPRK